MKINKSSDYSRFIQDPANRPVTEQDKPALNRLRASMEKYGFLEAFPIVCRREGEKLIVVDGQHRLLVAKQLGLAVSWVDCGRADIDAAETSATVRPWQFSDYVRTKSAQGYEHYKMLESFHEKSGLTLAACASLLSGATTSGCNLQKEIRDGTFCVRDPEYAHRVAGVIEVLKNHVPWALHALSVLAISRFARVKEFDAVQMVKKISAFPHLLRQCATLELYSEMFEAVYNHRAQNKIPLVFLTNQAMAARRVGGVRARKAPARAAA